MRGSVASRHVSKTLGGNDGSKSNHGIVAQVEKETRENRARPGARKSKNNANESQQTDKTPGPAELRRVHQAKERAGQHYAGHHASAGGARKFHAVVPENRRSNPHEHGIQVSAKNSFLHQWRDKHRHSHERERTGATLEQILDRNMIRLFDARAGNDDEDGQPAAGKKIHPRTALALVGLRLEFLPAERAPESQVAQDRQRDIEKKHDQREPENVQADEEAWIRLEESLELLFREVPVRGKIKDCGELQSDQTGDDKDAKN